MKLNTINLSDNLEYLKSLPDNSVDAIITDSPYGLGKKQNLIKILTAWLTVGYLEISGRGFMGKKWDAFVPQPILWKECLRFLKPGGYLVSFFGTRTYHLGATAIEIAGFEVRDQIDWIYGNGFPKSRASLKPAHEPICIAKKPGPLVELNIDECRIEIKTGDRKGEFGPRILENCTADKTKGIYGKFAGQNVINNDIGRWPANVILDEDSADELDAQTGMLNDCINRKTHVQSGLNTAFTTHKTGQNTATYNDIGGASRFFYCAKASPHERQGFKHPTIKPVKLMIHLVKLFCPPGGVVVDPHCGTGPTLEACLEVGLNYIGIDNDPASVVEANTRIANWWKRNQNRVIKKSA